MEYKNFGEFVSSMRKDRKITVRGLAELLGISAPFLTDVEKDRRNPFDEEKLEKLAQIFNLSREEKDTMYNLVGQKRDILPPDYKDYVIKRDYVSTALRTARDLDAGEEEWQRFVDELRSRKG